MYFIIASIIIAVSCSAITIKTLVGYNSFSIWIKLFISLLVSWGWFAPVLVFWLRKTEFFSAEVLKFLSIISYTMFGFVFLLIMLLLLRDFVWYLIFYLAKLFNCAGWWINPKNIMALGYANIVVVLMTIGLSVYAIKEATMVPAVKTLELSSSKLKKDVSIVQLSDLHINRASSLTWLQGVVDKTNALNPDIIVLTGDVVDDDVEVLSVQMDILQQLKAKNGLYFSMGNHESYNELFKILSKLQSMGIEILINRGIEVPNKNIFIAGIPDSQTAMSNSLFAVNFEKAVKGTKADNYRVLLSHNPEMINYVTKVAFDLQLSGHTHGGQIFPFHILVKKANGFLAGHYNVNGVDLYLSRGAGFWGPPMRLLAPSEISQIKIQAVKPIAKKSKKTKGKVDETLRELLKMQNMGLGL